MDIWSRLLGAGGSHSKKQVDVNSPQQRLTRFKKAHDQLQQIWRRNNASAKPAVGADSLTDCLRNLVTILQDEVQTPIPHLCARHVSTFQIYTILAQVSSMYNEEAAVRDSLEIFKVLLDSEEGDFVKEKTFADALIGYISSLSAAGLDAKMEAQMIEVLFAISAKLRLQPEILPAWFRNRMSDSGDEHESHRGGASYREDFPLFYLTVDYIYHEGRVGDFARTGLLYLIECAGQSSILEQWIIESDLATLMASGLGALYSQLSRKLVLSFEKDAVPAIVTISESLRPTTPTDAENTTSLDFRAHLTTFLSHLVFWQDVLEHCTSTEVKKTLLDHFKFLFLQQLLYPSLVESSDIDGGSSVAVLTYLRCIIESINHPDLVQLVFQYLLAVPEMDREEVRSSRPLALARRRKSETLVSNLAKGRDKPLPDLFNLVDLVLTSLRSPNQQTVTATLRLISVLLRNRHQYRFTLFKTQTSQSKFLGRPLDKHQHDVALLFSLTEDLASFETLHDSYETHLHDVQCSIECHDCSASLLALPGSESRKYDDVQFQSIEASDHLLVTLVGLLKGFLANDVQTNLSLTQVVSTLALCGSFLLTPWLLAPNSTKVDVVGKNPILDDKFTDLSGVADAVEYSNRDVGPVAYQHNIEGSQELSPILQALEDLNLQVERLRRSVLNFDVFLSERKHVFQIGEEIETAGADDSPRSKRLEDFSAKPMSRSKASPQIGSIPQRLLSQHSSVQSSRASSPRGRKMDPPSAPAPSGRLSHLHIPPSPTSATPDSRAFSPSPLRKANISITPPRSATPMGPADALRQKVKVRLPFVKTAPSKVDLAENSETNSLRSESFAAGPSEEPQYTEAGLSQVLTNVVILQEFMLELAAIIQVRASLFGEVRFD